MCLAKTTYASRSIGPLHSKIYHSTGKTMETEKRARSRQIVAPNYDANNTVSCRPHAGPRPLECSCQSRRMLQSVSYHSLQLAAYNKKSRQIRELRDQLEAPHVAFVRFRLQHATASSHSSQPCRASLNGSQQSQAARLKVSTSSRIYHSRPAAFTMPRKIQKKC